MKYRLFALIMMCGTLWASNSFAEPTRPIQFDAGVQAQFDKTTSAISFQMFVGYYQPIMALSSRWGMFASAGPHIEVGSLTIDRPQFDDSISVGRYAVGPLARLGLAYGEDTWADFYGYFGVGWIRSQVDYAGSLDVPEADGIWSSRLSVGLAFPGSYSAISESLEEDSGSHGAIDGIGLFFLLVPNTVEFNIDGWGQGGDVPVRYGFSVKWSI